MNLIIYIDMFFFVNLCMNLILLTVLYKVIKVRSNLFRIILAGMVGSLGACIAVIYPNMNVILKFIFLYIILSSVMIRIAFPYNGVRQLMVNVIKLYLLTFFIGGMFNFIYYNTSLGFFISEILSGERYQNMNIRFLIVSSVLVGITIPILIRVIDSVKLRFEQIYQVEIFMKDKRLITYGLVDTGNLLRDPISNKPVLIGEYDLIKTILPGELEDYATKLKVIPYHSLGQDKGTLYGVVFDQVNVKKKNQVKSNKDVIIGLYHGNLSAKKEYQVILHKDIL